MFFTAKITVWRWTALRALFQAHYSAISRPILVHEPDLEVGYTPVRVVLGRKWGLVLPGVLEILRHSVCESAVRMVCTGCAGG